MTQLTFGETNSIHKAYGDTGKNHYKRKAYKKLPDQITEKDRIHLKKFNEFCEKKGYQKNGIWDYTALVIRSTVQKTGETIIKNLNIKDVYKMYDKYKKSAKKYYTFVGIEEKLQKQNKSLNPKQKREMLLLRDEVIFK